MNRTIQFRVNRNTTPMMQDIKKLEEVGFGIGHGNAMYRYKMPEPKKDDMQRILRVFRRHV